MTFWQAYRRSLAIFIKTLGVLASASVVGGVGGWLIASHHIMTAAVYFFAVVVSGLALQARDIQRRGF